MGNGCSGCGWHQHLSHCVRRLESDETGELKRNLEEQDVELECMISEFKGNATFLHRLYLDCVY